MQEKKNQEMLLNKQLFVEEALQIFAIIEQTGLTPDDWWFHEPIDLTKFQYSLVYSEIREFHDPHIKFIVTKKEFLDHYERSETWESFVVDTVHNWLKNRNGQDVHPQLIQLVSDWLRRHLEVLDFSTHIRSTAHRGFTMNALMEKVKELYVLIQPELPDALILKMLKGDYETFMRSLDDTSVGHILMKTVNDKVLFKQAVLANVRDTRLSMYVRCSLFQLSMESNIKECLPQLYEVITADASLRDYERKRLTEFYVSLGGTMEDFSAFLSV